jgi:hypothetical protein
MKTPFLAKVRYVKQKIDGTYGHVKEEYLIYGYSFTDVEAVIYDKLGSIIRGEFIIISINRFNVVDCLIESNSEWFYLVKIKYTPIDDESGKKSVTQRLIVEAKNIEEANKIVVEHFDKIGLQYEKVEVKKTNIIEIFVQDEENENDNTVEVDYKE